MISVDTTAPTIHLCPSDISQDLELGRTNTTVNWTIPTATDASGTVILLSQSHTPGISSFMPGRTTVTYKFVDGSGNEASCNFDVIISQGD